MTAVENAAVSQEELDAKAWAASPRATGRRILTSATSSRRTTPRTRRRDIPAPATEKTKHLWKYLDDNYLAVERKQRVYDVDTHTPADVDAFPGRLHRLPGSR